MRKVTEMRSIPKVGGKIFFPPPKQKITMSFSAVTTLVEGKENRNKLKGVGGTYISIICSATRMLL